jgi:hypothetical protein
VSGLLAFDLALASTLPDGSPHDNSLDSVSLLQRYPSRFEAPIQPFTPSKVVPITTSGLPSAQQMPSALIQSQTERASQGHKPPSSSATSVPALLSSSAQDAPQDAAAILVTESSTQGTTHLEPKEEDAGLERGSSLGKLVFDGAGQFVMPTTQIGKRGANKRPNCSPGCTAAIDSEPVLPHASHIINMTWDLSGTLHTSEENAASVPSNRLGACAGLSAHSCTGVPMRKPVLKGSGQGKQEHVVYVCVFLCEHVVRVYVSVLRGSGQCKKECLVCVCVCKYVSTRVCVCVRGGRYKEIGSICALTFAYVHLFTL